jgi:hypothetical protein
MRAVRATAMGAVVVVIIAAFVVEAVVAVIIAVVVVVTAVIASSSSRSRSFSIALDGHPINDAVVAGVVVRNGRGSGWGRSQLVQDHCVQTSKPAVSWA